uniref:Ras-related protein RABH1b n=1 Tax=Heterorhabditis bacteriophora TaxID=37862 RepID=A0A1I7XDN1_HETBA
MKFIETSAVTGENILDAFLMMAQDVSNRVEEGSLKPMDGWEGIKCGMMRSQSISLSENDDPTSGYGSTCSC